ncbi:MAG TPA: alpha-amylase family glycosyl hydrolase, partial [Bacteroidales bacterium]|nr:alpha-amylase family glycosyl hydrolase [Bacteroidales bacterium]
GTTENGPFSAQFSFVVLSSAAEITSFSLPEQTGAATINPAAATVSIEVAHGTGLNSLTPTITVSGGATINPASGVAQNFSSPVVYTVTAQDGITTKQWTVTVTVAAPTPIGWANLQWPPTGNIQPGQEFMVYAQVYADGITNLPGQASGMQAWIGYSSTNTDPAGWTNWHAASYLGDVGNNDEYSFNLGGVINNEGTYYYASRFSLNGQPYVYGGYSSGGGGFWNGTTNNSGTLTIAQTPQTFPVTFTVIDGTQSYTDIRFKGQMTSWNTMAMTQSPPHTWTITLNLNPGSYEWGVIQHDGSPDGVWLIQGPNLVVHVAADGTVSGTVTYNIPAPPPSSIVWANLQWPASATIEPSQTLNVYGKVYIPDVTGIPVAPAGLQAWVGYSSSNTDPSGWTNWIPATFNGPSGNDSEYRADLGSQINANGTYYYAMRYQYQNQNFVYGGYSGSGGGFWNGTTNLSGVLTVGVNIDCEQFRGIVYTTPSFPAQNQALTLYFDATKGNGALLNYTGDVYVHTGVITNLSSSDADWRYTKTAWGENSPSTLLTRISANLYSLTIPNPRNYYGVPGNEQILKMVLVFRSATANTQGNWLVHKNSDGSDILVKFYQPGLNVKFNNPLTRQTLLTSSATLPVCIEANGHTQLSFYINSTLVRQTNGSGLSYQLSYQQMPAGINWIKAVATNGSITLRDSVEVYVRGAVNVASLPTGVKKGINYVNNNTVTLVLHDPIAQKQFSYVIGDFNNWTISDAGYMNRTPDGTHYWITISGLTPGEEYGFQYLVDGTLRLADPYSELILDPWNDPWISPNKYPNLKPYPEGKTEGIVTLIQPGRAPYNWQVNNFTPPAINNNQSDLLIYELLLRDFNDTQSIADAIEKLDYLKSIGVNAIQLMPIMEFDGNNSWGYSTNFFFATDKYYGTREAYKQFIDAAHAKGMAVILDIVMNHAFGLNPFVKMYFDPNYGGYGAPAANNPWLNQQSPHPYSVGYDFNHESTHTRQFFKEVLQYWLTEFKVDGFRIDLSKGLTQNFSGGDVGAWNANDQSRVNILMDYYGHIKWVNPNAYVILEHFANNDEETVLANAGMLLWSAMHYSYKQVAMGWENNSNVQWAYHGTRGWNYPNLIDYMESHDEERMVYEALAYGNQSQWYNLRDSLTAIRHQEQAIVLFMGIPGPKMIWQFQEMGYDYSIWYGGDRTAPKPPRWDYLDNPARERLARVVKGMADLRKSDAFRFGNFAHDLGGLGKRMWITHQSMDVVMCVNMGVFGFDMIPNFTKPGIWYDYFSGEAINVSNPATHSFFFGPGDYRVFTSVPRPKPWHNLIVNVRDAATNQPIANALVQLANAGSRVTDSNGQVQFLALPGSNAVSASKFGYLTGSQSFEVTAPAEITILLQPGWDPQNNFANLQWPPEANILVGESANVYAQVQVEGVPLGPTGYENMQVWIGVNAANTNPGTWTTWIPATYNGISSFTSRPEYTAAIGSTLPAGTYYYTSRFQLPDQPFIYGGWSATGGGFWDGTTHISGILTISAPPPPGISFANLQWPPTASITVGGSVTVYAQIQATGVNLGTNGYEGLSAWIGYGATGTSPSAWTNWVSAAYNGVSGFTGRPEYTANIGSSLPEGNYDYAARFQLGSGDFVYGGYSSEGGGFWNGTANVSGLLTVSNTGPVPSIGWANLQGPASGVIAPAQPFSVFGQVWIENTTGSGTATTGLQAWVGYSADNTNPNSWTNWVPASYNGAVGNNDRFTAEIGSLINNPGTYYYATRYQYLDQPFVYGGLNGPWDAETSPSGLLTVTTTPPVPEITFANLQWPPTASITVGGSVTVYAQIQATGVNLGTNGYEGLSAWIGYGATGTSPSAWTNWVSAAYNGVSGFTGRPEYTANIGSTLPEGNYDYAARFQLGSGDFVYGGYSSEGGGFWNGTANVSGLLTVSNTGPVPSIGWANLQGPASGVIAPAQPFSVFGQVWIENTTGSGTATAGLQAWVGYSADNTNPNSWTSWVPASYNGAVGNNDRFTAEIGSLINT